MAGATRALPDLNAHTDSVCLANTCYSSDTDGSSSDSQGRICRVQGWVMYHARIDLQSMKDPEGDLSFRRDTGLLPQCVMAPPPLSTSRAGGEELDFTLWCFGYFFLSLLFPTDPGAVLLRVYLSGIDKEKIKL